MNEPELSRLLHGAVADLPDTSDRVRRVAHRVRIHRRRRRLALASAVGVVAVVAAIVVPVAATRHASPDPAAGSGAGCAPGNATLIDHSAPVAVPEGATSLTVCSYNFDATRLWLHVLHSDVEQVAARLRALPGTPPPKTCDAVGRRNYGFTFRYSSGREVPFRLDLSGCGEFLDVAVVQPTLRLLDAQRLSDAAGRPLRAPSCPAASAVRRPATAGKPPRFDPLVPLPGLVPTYERVVTACRYGWQSTAPGSPPVLQAHAAGRSSLSSLRAAVNASTGIPGRACFVAVGGIDILLFADQAQGVVEVRVARQPCAAIVTQQGVGHATPALLGLLDGLLDRPGQKTVPTAVPPCSAPLSSGTGAHPPVPARPDLLRVCEGNTPVYDLSTPDAATYAKLIAAAPLAGRCPPDGPAGRPSSRRLIFGVGRSATVLELTVGNCARVSTRDGTWLASPLLAAKLGAR